MYYALYARIQNGFHRTIPPAYFHIPENCTSFQSVNYFSFTLLSKYSHLCGNWYTSPIELGKFLSIYCSISVKFLSTEWWSFRFWCLFAYCVRIFFHNSLPIGFFLIHTRMSSGIGDISNSETQLNVTIKPLLLGFRIKCTILWTNSNRFYL